MAKWLAQESSMYKRLLVPVDGGELSTRAMRESVTLAAQLQASVTGFVVESMPPLPTSGAALAHYEHDAKSHTEKTDAHAYRVLGGFAELAANAGVAFQALHAQDDDIAGAIARAADAQGSDLIVMATHGRGLFGELLFGSQTKGVMARTRVPLLVLH